MSNESIDEKLSKWEEILKGWFGWNKIPKWIKQLLFIFSLLNLLLGFFDFILLPENFVGLIEKYDFMIETISNFANRIFGWIEVPFDLTLEITTYESHYYVILSTLFFFQLSEKIHPAKGVKLNKTLNQIGIPFIFLIISLGHINLDWIIGQILGSLLVLILMILVMLGIDIAKKRNKETSYTLDILRAIFSKFIPTVVIIFIIYIITATIDLLL